MFTLDTETRSAHPQGKALSQRFLWGAATAAYQIEGAAFEDGRGESIWDRFCRTPGKVANGDTGDVACDHYHRYRDDVALMRSLGLDAYRFSIAWPRLFATGSGPLNPKGVAFYDRLVDELLQAGIEPFATLYHWDLPQPLEDAGGWPNIETAERFADYAAACFEALGDRVSNWITINEPWCVASLGYVQGAQAPGKTDESLGFLAGHTLLAAHGRAVQRFREICPDGSIGITINPSPFHPVTDSPADRSAAARSNESNGWFLDPIYFGDYPAVMREAHGNLLPEFTDDQRTAVGSPVDFIGLNYYFRGVVADDPDGPGLRTRWAPPSGNDETAMGWEIYPDGLAEILHWTADRYGNPLVYVTESGAAFEDTVSADGRIHDAQRRAYLESHFRAALRARDAGVRLGGYFVWSLLDNFEWAYGYDKRFGIVHVDYETQARTLKDSALWYATQIRENLGR